MSLSKQWSLKKAQRKLKNTYRQVEMKTQQSKTNGCSKSSSKREVYSDKHLRHQTQKLSNEQRKIEKKEQAKPKVGRRKEIIKIKAEINKIDTKKKQLQRSMKLKACSLKR